MVFLFMMLHISRDRYALSRQKVVREEFFMTGASAAVPAVSQYDAVGYVDYGVELASLFRCLPAC